MLVCTLHSVPCLTDTPRRDLFQAVDIVQFRPIRVKFLNRKNLGMHLKTNSTWAAQFKDIPKTFPKSSVSVITIASLRFLIQAQHQHCPSPVSLCGINECIHCMFF